MATAKIGAEQAALLEAMGLPPVLSTDMPDEEWFEIGDLLSEEIQLRGINEAGDGTNARGDLCVGILDAMARAEDEAAMSDKAG